MSGNSKPTNWESLLKSRRSIFNFDFRFLFQIFFENNIEVIEKEDNQDCLVEYVRENNVWTTAVTRKSYLAWVKRVFYARLILIQRQGRIVAKEEMLIEGGIKNPKRVYHSLGQNNVQQLPELSVGSLGKMFQFDLSIEESSEIEIEEWTKRQVMQLKHETEERIQVAVDAISKFLEISKEKAAQELESIPM